MENNRICIKCGTELNEGDDYEMCPDCEDNYFNERL